MKTVMYKTYELVCQLPANRASEQIERLLLEEGVKYTVTDLVLTSVKTPIAVLGIQPNFYGHSNWVGINPFTFISAIDVRYESVEEAVTEIIIRVNRFRAFLWVLFWLTCSLFAASAMSRPDGAILIFGVTCAAWFGIVRFLAGYLIKKEIGESVKSPQHRGNDPLPNGKTAPEGTVLTNN